MVAVPAGSYPRLADGVAVTVGAHCLDRTEVTVAAYKKCVDAGACTAPDAVGAGKAKGCNWRRAGAGDHPVNCVDFAQAGAYCRWASGRLPTDGEWEWSARGEAAGTKHPWGNASLVGRGCYDDEARDESPGGTCKVGSYPKGANPRGVLDLTGNVWEWTSTEGAKPGEAIDRGGGWLNGDEGMLSIGKRNSVPKASRYSSLGFRCAR